MLLVEQGLADKINLAPLYERLAAAIRQVDQEHMIFYEPALVDITPLGFQHGPGGPDYNNRSVLSYHSYCGDVDEVCMGLLSITLWNHNVRSSMECLEGHLRAPASMVVWFS